MKQLLGQLFANWLKRRLPAQPKVVLSQRHIFIVPSAAGYGFALCLLLILLVAINYQNSLAYAMAFLLGAVGLLSMLHTWRNLAGLELRAMTIEPCFAGQQAVVGVELLAKQRAHLALALGFGRTNATHSITSVAAQQQQQVRISLPMAKRGLHQIPRIRVASSYPLGLWYAWSMVDLAQQALVYPKPIAGELSAAGAATEHGEDGVQAAGRGVDDYDGLVSWQPGESLSRINWKSWSRGQGLWVKQFNELQGRRSELDFNLLTGAVEQRLSILCAQVLELSAQDVAFSLNLPNQRINTGQGSAHQQQCLAALALFGGGAHD